MNENLFKDRDEKLISSSPGYMTQEDLEKKQEIDKTALLADISHQLEEARLLIESLENKNRNLSERMMRGEAARDAMKDLLMEMWRTTQAGKL